MSAKSGSLGSGSTMLAGPAPIRTTEPVDRAAAETGGGGKPQATLKVIVGMVAFGLATTLLSKSLLATWSVDMHGSPKQFQRPWATAAAVYISYLLVEPLIALLSRFNLLFMCHRDGEGSGGDGCVATRAQECDFEANGPVHIVGDGNGGAEHESRSRSAQAALLNTKQQIMFGLVPATFLSMSAPLLYMALFVLPVSIWQMLRSSSIVFCALIGMVVLKKRYTCFEWLGITACLIGVCAVGLSEILASETGIGDPATLALGSGRMLLSQVFWAAAGISEEYLIKKCFIPPARLASIEGAWSIASMICIVFPIMYILPGADNGHVDDIFDTLALLKNSGQLIVMYLSFILCFSGFIYCGIMISARKSTVHRWMLDCVRTCLIWGVGLLVNYCISDMSPLSESLTKWSTLELIGFGFIVLGQALFGGIMHHLQNRTAKPSGQSN